MVFAAPQRRSLARLGVLAPTPITLRPATMATAPFGRICCSPAPVACATRRTCAHANHAAPCDDGNCPLRTDLLLLSAGRFATRRACAHANQSAPCGLTSWGRNASGGGGCRTANAAVRLFGGTTSLHSTAPHIADESEPRSESSGARRPSPAANLRVYRTPHSISRHACAHTNHAAPCGLRDCPLRTDWLLLSAGRLRD